MYKANEYDNKTPKNNKNSKTHNQNISSDLNKKLLSESSNQYSSIDALKAMHMISVDKINP